MNKVILPTQEKEKKKNIFTKIWEKTVFPDKIKQKKELNQIKREAMHEAKIEAMQELKPTLKQRYKQKELDKMTGKKDENKKGALKKFAEGMKLPEGFGSDEQLAKMLGPGSSSNADVSEKILGKKEKKSKEKKEEKEESQEEWADRVIGLKR
jgi:hypothetical protein